jgi:pimeloyl-ACP methyl ester carboxylesterase
MAYDAARGQVVLFGGLDINNVLLNDTWVWDGTDWTQKSPANSPTPRAQHEMAYDALRGQVVLFGGWDGSGTPNDTWVWESGSASPTGTISATTNLPAAAFTITGPANYSGSGTSLIQTNAPAGTYTITYGAVNCYSTPPSESKTLTAGGVLTFSGGTYQGRASISVSVAPAGATSATFSINPPVPGMPSNGPYPRTQTNVWPQSYTVAFNSVTGFTPPPAQTLAPNSSCQIVFAGTYAPTVSPGMGTLAVTVSPNTNSLGKFTIADSQGKVIASSVSSFSSPLPGGKYSIKYAPLVGFYTPPDRTVVHAPPTPSDIRGIYRRLILVSFTGWGNAPYSVVGGNGCVINNCPGFGVAYPDNLLSCSGRGMTNITLEARGQAAPSPSLSTSVLAPGLASSAFTFYDNFNELSPCSAPAGQPDHATAEAWVRSLNPTSDDLIAVTGHSYGGNRARLFAEQLRINKVRDNARFATDALIMVDPVDWTTCDGLNMLNAYNFLVSDPRCFQTGSPRELPQGVGAFRDFTQSQALTSGINISGYPITVGGVIQYQALRDFTDVGHSGIDDDPRVHLFILQALSGLVRGPTPTAAIAGTPSRDSSGLSYPIRVTATPVGTATGFGTATGVRITSASLNGVPATSMLPSSILGDIVAGSSSSVVNLVFPSSAAAKGSSVLLTVAFENSDGAPYTNTIRQVAP